MTAPTKQSVLRALAADAAQAERARTLDALQQAIIARQRYSGRERQGRERAGLELAVDLLDLNTLPGEPYDELVGSVSTEVDTVDVGVYLGRDADGQMDTMPIRLAAHDGADSTTAYAYLPVGDAEDLIEALRAAVSRVRADEADHDH